MESLRAANKDSLSRSVTDKLETTTSDIVVLQQNAVLANTYTAPQHFIHPINRNIQLRKKSFDANTAEIEDFRSILSHFQREAPNPESFTEFKQKKSKKCNKDPTEVILNHTQPYNTVARLSMHNDQVLVETHNIFSKSSPSSAFCHMAAQKSYLHNYSWPKCLVNNIEGSKKIHRKRRQEMVQLMPHSLEDGYVSETLSQEPQHFILNGKANHLLWETNTTLIPSVRYEDAPFRHPSACISDIAEQMSAEYNRSASMSHFHAELRKILTKRLSLNNVLQSKYDEALDVSQSFYKSPKLSETDTEKVRNQIVVGLLGRHLEAISDASVHLVLDTLKPFIKVCCSNTDEEHEERGATISISEKGSLSNRGIQFRQQAAGDAVNIQVSAAELGMIDEEEGCSVASLDKSLNKHTPKRKRDSNDADGTVKRKFVEFVPRRLSTSDIARLRSLQSHNSPDKPVVNWKHVMFALQTASDRLNESPGNQSYHVHDSLPSLPLTSSVVERIKYRLEAIYSKPDIPGISKSQPQILPRVNLDKKFADQNEKTTIL